MEHQLRATIHVLDADEAVTRSRSICNDYFGCDDWTSTLTATATVTVSDRIIYAEVDIDAELTYG